MIVSAMLVVKFDGSGVFWGLYVIQLLFIFYFFHFEYPRELDLVRFLFFFFFFDNEDFRASLSAPRLIPRVTIIPY